MESTKGSIFINYRKDDSSWNALALYNELQKYFAKEQLFKDFNTILPGDDFTVSIQNALRKCDVLIVVIGKNWLDMKDALGRRRLDDPDDFVRIEISTALERNIQVIPVLFDNITMPRNDELPDNLKGMTRRQFIEIETKRFDDDVRNLAEAIRKVLTNIYPDHPNPGPGPAPRPAPPQPGPKPQPLHNNPVAAGKPDNNMVFAIISTVLCCLPLGIVAIINASKVDGLWNEGRHDEARTMAAKAKQFSIYAIITGVIVIGLYMAMMFAGGGLNY